MASNIGQLLKKKSTYLSKVYLLLAFQIILTMVVVFYLRQHQQVYESIKKYSLLWLILAIGILFVLLLMPKLPMPVKLLLFSIFTILISFNCIAASKKVSFEIIKAALWTTVALFVFMSIIGLIIAGLGIDLSFLSFAILIALVGLFIAMIVMHFVKVDKTVAKVIFIIGVVLFSVLIAFDTNLMLLKNIGVLDGAIGLYLDVINLFNFNIALE